MSDKRTYTNIKDYGNDMSYENEVKFIRDDRGALDLTKQIEVLKGQKKFLQERLRKAGKEINELKNFTNDEIVNNIIKKHIARHKQGMETFGKTIQDNKRPPKEWISEAQQEAMDFIVYLEKLDKTL